MAAVGIPLLIRNRGERSERKGRMSSGAKNSEEPGDRRGKGAVSYPRKSRGSLAQTLPLACRKKQFLLPSGSDIIIALRPLYRPLGPIV